jgi:hypothetical protein
VQNVQQNSTTLGLNLNDLRELRKPAGERKATVACVTSLLRPGKSVAVAIQDCRWLDAETLQRVPRLTAAQDFLGRLLEL